ncbi:MAG: tRNA (adenosine(37)-N6)-dimethylallyltransferase MiaA [Oscillospiraceae bacterium]|jgi:tRNA dimethylallyltransferase|nr:tRNA (adenosine(37)-N6)-dimethylallyltransferase MiaA [Oscillospiraceae bacterium]
MKKIFVVVICGPTASGKTALAVHLAEQFGGEIIGADSMQIYKGMNIATAKPAPEELRGVKHHLIDFLEPHEAFSVAEYVDLARVKIAEVHGRGKLPVIAGGTGLYINSLIDNIEFPEIKADMVFRAEKQKTDAGILLGELREKDPGTAEQLHENNKKRIIRALEVLHITGRTMGELKTESRLNPSPYKPLMLQIEFHRNELYERIDRRVDLMLEMGLLDEARAFYALGNTPTSAQAIGYKELLPYLNGEAGLEECVENLKKSTRNYAKRQITWFKKDPRIHLLAPEKAFKHAENLILNIIAQIS